MYRVYVNLMACVGTAAAGVAHGGFGFRARYVGRPSWHS
jgi:hypothetical protein